MRSPVVRLLLAAGSVALLTCSHRSGGGGSGTEPPPPAAVDQCKTALSRGDLIGAQAAASDALAADPNGCGTLYCGYLTVALDLIAQVNNFASLLKAAPTSTSGLAATCTGLGSTCKAPGSLEDLTDLAAAALSGVQRDAAALGSQASPLEAGDCTFDLESFPIIIDTGDPTTSFQYRLGRHWDVREVRLGELLGHALNAAIDLLLAHRITIDPCVITGCASTNGQHLGGSLSDPLGTLRNLGVLFWTSSTLLTFTPDYATRLQGLPGELSRGAAAALPLVVGSGGGAGDLLRVASLAPYVQEPTTPGDPLSGSVLGVTDVNQDGSLDGGDRIWLGCVDDARGGVPCITPDPYTFPAAVTAGASAAGGAILARMRDLLTPPVAPGATVDLSWIDGFVEALGQQPLPDVVAVDVGTFLANPKPLRGLLPAWAPDPCGNVWLLVEGEAPANATGTPGGYVTLGDAPHFGSAATAVFAPAGCGGGATQTAATTLPADGISPDLIPADLLGDPSQIRNRTLYYAAWQDPTFGGVLTVNLGAIDSAQPNAFVSPSAATLATVLAWIQREAARRGLLSLRPSF